jgi:hypothetical protein
MPDFTVHMGLDPKATTWNMPDRGLMDAFEKWLTNRKKEPDHFIGTIGAGDTKQRVAVYFPCVAAIVEKSPPASAGFQQQSPALKGKMLPGHS